MAREDSDTRELEEFDLKALSKDVEDIDDDATTLAKGNGKDADEPMPFPHADLDPAKDYEPLAERPLAELAEGARAVVFRDGKVFRERKPNMEMARAIKSGEADEFFVTAGGQESPIPDKEARSDVANKSQEYIFGSDSRYTVGDYHPYDKTVYLSSGCSGVYIGPRTLLTAAHCVVNSNGTLRSSLWFAPYRQGGATPHGWHSLQSSDTISVPGAYITLEATTNGYSWDMMHWDYAVVSFASTPAPLADVGSLGIWVNKSASGWFYVYGYPGGGCPGTSADPVVCGSGGSAYLNGNGGAFFETDNIDFLPGNSGGPWQVSSGGNRYVVGVSIAERSYFDLFQCGFDLCRRNDARRIDSGVYSFIRAASRDY
jgi:V8-like Glu-specific endopeptidase